MNCRIGVVAGMRTCGFRAIIYLTDNVDREFATTAAAFLATNEADISFAVRGNWLHIHAT